MASVGWLLHCLRKFLKVSRILWIGHLKFLSIISLRPTKHALLGSTKLKTNRKGKVYNIVGVNPWYFHIALSNSNVSSHKKGCFLLKLVTHLSSLFVCLFFVGRGRRIFVFLCCSNSFHEFCHLGKLGIESHILKFAILLEF